ncbi:MAG TPA: hypothetical protein VH590_17610, partial [Ktedonobacterales bacterium]
SASAAASGQIFTFFILGILALLFIWLYLQQRRLLRRLTPPTPPDSRRPIGETDRAGLARANAARRIPSDAAERWRSALSNGQGAAGSDDDDASEKQQGERGGQAQ